MDQIKADAEKAIEHHRRREWKMGEAIANIAWRLGLCHSLSPDVKAAWLCARGAHDYYKGLLDSDPPHHHPPSSPKHWAVKAQV